MKNILWPLIGGAKVEKVQKASIYEWINLISKVYHRIHRPLRMLIYTLRLLIFLKVSKYRIIQLRKTLLDC